MTGLRILFLRRLAPLAFCACAPAQPGADRLLLDFEQPLRPTQITTVDAVVQRILTDDGPVLRVEAGHHRDWPAVTLRPTSGTWDLSENEYVLVSVRNLSDRPMRLYSRVGNPAIDDKLLSLRRKTGSNYVEKSGALRACIEAMKRGDSIGLLVDQRVDRGIEVSFFETPTLFTDLPARLALKFNCPIIPAEAVRAGPCHCEVIIHPPIWPDPKRGAQAVGELTQQIATVIEGAIRRRPDEWFCNKRRWEKPGRVDKVPDPQAARSDVFQAGIT